MATTTLTSRSRIITVSGTDENDINFDAVLDHDDKFAQALITMISGSNVQFDASGVTIDSSSSQLSTSGNNYKELYEIRKGVNIKYRGGAGGETFIISIITI